jgi:sigma-E factor negative regulatory protein RseC
MVYHDGHVVETNENQVRVKIISKSACADCHAKGICTAADMEEKFIDAIAQPGERFRAGDTVTLVMEERLGWIAIFYSFVLPFIVMVTVLFVMSGLGRGETEAALFGLGSLLPYYLLLYVFREKIEKDFSFKAERKRET